MTKTMRRHLQLGTRASVAMTGLATVLAAALLAASPAMADGDPNAKAKGPGVRSMSRMSNDVMVDYSVLDALSRSSGTNANRSGRSGLLIPQTGATRETNVARAFDSEPIILQPPKGVAPKLIPPASMSGKKTKTAIIKLHPPAGMKTDIKLAAPKEPAQDVAQEETAPKEPALSTPVRTAKVEEPPAKMVTPPAPKVEAPKPAPSIPAEPLPPAKKEAVKKEAPKKAEPKKEAAKQEAVTKAPPKAEPPKVAAPASTSAPTSAPTVAPKPVAPPKVATAPAENKAAPKPAVMTPPPPPAVVAPAENKAAPKPVEPPKVAAPAPAPKPAEPKMAAVPAPAPTVAPTPAPAAKPAAEKPPAATSPAATSVEPPKAVAPAPVAKAVEPPKVAAPAPTPVPAPAAKPVEPPKVAAAPAAVSPPPAPAVVTPPPIAAPAAGAPRSLLPPAAEQKPAPQPETKVAVVPPSENKAVLKAVEPVKPEAIEETKPAEAKTEDTKPAEVKTAALPKGPETLTIAFPVGVPEVPGDAAADIKGLAARLKGDAALRVQLLAFASDPEKSVSRSRRLSLERAVNVRKQLLTAGIDSTRIEVRALGEQSGDGAPDRVDAITSRR